MRGATGDLSDKAGREVFDVRPVFRDRLGLADRSILTRFDRTENGLLLLLFFYKNDNVVFVIAGLTSINEGNLDKSMEREKKTIIDVVDLRRYNLGRAENNSSFGPARTKRGRK